MTLRIQLSTEISLFTSNIVMLLNNLLIHELLTSFPYSDRSVLITSDRYLHSNPANCVFIRIIPSLEMIYYSNYTVIRDDIFLFVFHAKA